MRTRFVLLALGALLLPAAPAAAQTIRAGMTADEVRALLGEPAVVRQADGWRYLFYANGCAPRCGSDDVVFVREGRVVAAVFRTPRRRFVGPAASRALEAAPDAAPGTPPRTGVGRGMEHPGIRVLGSPTEEREGAAEVEGIRIRIPGTGDVSVGGEVIRPGADTLAADTLAAEPLLADTALDRSRQQREERVTPRTVPAREPGDVRPDTALDRRRQERERRVEPRTVRPRPPGRR